MTDPLDSPPGRTSSTGSSPAPDSTDGDRSPTGGEAETDPTSSGSPLRSVHSASLPRILSQHRASLAVTTYQAGRLVLLRPEARVDGSVLNTHFRSFNKPMGFAWEPGRCALGTHSEVWEFHDMPAVARKLDSPEMPGRHDAAFLPRTVHYTGDVQVHEMAWVPPPGAVGKPRSAAGFSELWFVNTRFSCLATRSDIYSFVPRWKPPFITGLTPQDRCHLNGMGLRDGRPRYVTALGETDGPAEWRGNKRSGGILMDVQSNQVITRGLSMPHSPRWHQGTLWVLESGRGGVGTIDEKTGKYTEICRLPGFTRGLDFLGPYAFVGLSQIRESAVFSDIPIAEMKQEERCCGVWVIEVRSGNIVGLVKFVQAVQEIFAVQVLSGMVWPEVLSEDPKRIAECYELPNEAMQLVPQGWRQPSGGKGDAEQ
jgi:uncharacterized protein (TIGR03032 family)